MMTMPETMMATSFEVGIVILLAEEIELVQRSFSGLKEKMCIPVALLASNH
jgi:hypothetical protein